jgi:hypothetical protein
VEFDLQDLDLWSDDQFLDLKVEANAGSFDLDLSSDNSSVGSFNDSCSNSDSCSQSQNSSVDS